MKKYDNDVLLYALKYLANKLSHVDIKSQMDEEDWFETALFVAEKEIAKKVDND